MPANAASIIRCRPCRINNCGNCKGRAEGCNCDHPDYNPSDEVIWKEPPSNRTINWQPNVKKLEQLIRNPGRWGIIETFEGNSTASSYANKLRKDVKYSTYRFRGAKIRGSKGSELYAVYVAGEGT